MDFRALIPTLTDLEIRYYMYKVLEVTRLLKLINFEGVRFLPLMRVNK